MKKIGVIIPCYNEESGIPALGDALLSLQQELAGRYQLLWFFVDDGSTDTTFSELEKLAGKLGGAAVLRHERNRNLGAALRTGIRAASATDYLCFLDSDCTYDPLLLKPLLERLEEGADLATVSPYHPEGRVEGVPGWRLFLSRALSACYRLVSGARIHTFTAMVRAQRTEHAEKTMGASDDFTYVTEVLLKSLAAGLVVREVPAVLRVRRFGVSKMRLGRTILAHLRLLALCLLGREL
jgi:dolichol-phosphate mannosyltransferase